MGPLQSDVPAGIFEPQGARARLFREERDHRGCLASRLEGWLGALLLNQKMGNVLASMKLAMSLKGGGGWTCCPHVSDLFDCLEARPPV